jgi:hypothetical protein
MMTRRLLATAGSMFAVVAAAACGNLTPGGLTGKVTVAVSGDADTLTAAAQVAPTFTSMPVLLGAPSAGSGPSASPEEAEGQLQVKFRAFLVSESGGAVQLGDDELQVQVELRGRTEADVVDAQIIPALLYTEFRLVFSEIKAEVEGLVIDGEPVTEVHVELQDLSLEVSVPLDLRVEDGDMVDLVIDLNSLAWLAAVDPLTGAVDETVFAGLVNVEIR